MSGNVFIEEKKIDKPGYQVLKNCNIVVKRNKNDQWVSRGGYKLDKAINYFNLDCKNIVALDIGSSTGGFTDVLLKKGAKKIYSVDVGYGQLDFKLRENTKVKNLERTNARYLTKEEIGEKIDLIVMDVSFISITKFESFFKEFAHKNSLFIGLIKPQFELSRDKLGKNGIVRNPKYRQEAIENIINFLNGFYLNILEPIESPIKGSKGNIEYLVCGRN